MIIAIVYLLAAALVYAGVVAATSLSALTLGGLLTLASWSSFLLVGLALATLAYILSPDGASMVVSRVAGGAADLLEGAGTIIGGAGSGIVSAADGILSAIFKSSTMKYLLLGGAVFFGYKYLTKEEDSNAVQGRQGYSDPVPKPE